MSPAEAVTRPRPTGRAHAMRVLEAGGQWSCTLCDWSHPLDGIDAASSAAEARVAFAADDRHSAARPVVEALLSQAAAHVVQLERQAEASRAGAQRVALSRVLEKWRRAGDTAAAVRVAAPGLAVALDVLAEVNA